MAGRVLERVERREVERLVERLLRESVKAFYSVCMGCGLCNSVCPVYRATRNPLMTPMARVGMARLLVEGRADPGRVQRYLFTCLLCGACSSACPYGLDIYRVIYLARSLLSLRGHAPREFTRMAEAASKTMHSFGVQASEALEGVARAAGERVDRRGARILYVPSPVETAFLPSHAAETARLLEAAGVDWTVSRSVVDCGGNIGVDASRPDVGLKLLANLAEAAEKLGVVEVALGACGSDYKWVSLAGELLHELGLELPELRFTSVYTILARRQPRHSAGVSAGRVVVHDPCSMSRYFRVDSSYMRLLPTAVRPKHGGPYTVCCGAAGGLSLRRDPEARGIMLSIASRRVRELARYSTRIVTPCIKCYIAFRTAIVREKLLGKITVEGLSTHLLKLASHKG